jgi:hypothetical protein
MRHITVLAIFLAFLLTANSQNDFVGIHEGYLIKSPSNNYSLFLNLELKDNNNFIAVMNRNEIIYTVTGTWNIVDSYIYLKEDLETDNFYLFPKMQLSLKEQMQFLSEINPEKYQNNLTSIENNEQTYQNLLEVSIYKYDKPKIHIYSNKILQVDTLNSKGELFYENNADSILLIFGNKELKYIPRKDTVPNYIYIGVKYRASRLPEKFKIKRKGKLEYNFLIGDPMASSQFNKEKKETLKRLK